MKKVLVLVLVAVFLTLSLAGCSTGATTSSPAESSAAASQPSASSTASASSAASASTAGTDLKMPATGMRFSVALPDSGAAYYVIMANNIKKFVANAGGTVVFESTKGVAEKQIAWADAEIAAGSKALVFGPAADSVIPIIQKKCEAAGIYFGIAFRSILDDNIRAAAEASKYYVGNCYENEEQTAYNLMKTINEKGIKNIAVISTPKGDTTGDLRDKGVAKACTEFGMTVVAEARDMAQAADGGAATESFLAAYKDLDAIVILGTRAAGVHDAVIKALKDSESKVKLAYIDFQAGMTDAFNDGVLIAAAGLPHWGFDPFMASVKTFNAAMGSPINDKCFATPIGSLIITDAASSQKYDTAFASETAAYFPDDHMINTLVKANNPQLDQKAFDEIAANYNPLK